MNSGHTERSDEKSDVTSAGEPSTADSDHDVGGFGVSDQYDRTKWNATGVDLDDTSSPVQPQPIATDAIAEGSGNTRKRTFLDGLKLPISTLPDAEIAAQERENQTWILRVCRALIVYGAPTHRLETYMHKSAEALGLNIKAFYLPGCMIMSFDDPDGRSKDVQIVRGVQNLNLAKLADVHEIYRDVIHKRVSSQDATARLDELVEDNDHFQRWLSVLMYGLASAFIGPISYQARPVDLPLIFVLDAQEGQRIFESTERYGPDARDGCLLQTPSHGLYVNGASDRRESRVS